MTIKLEDLKIVDNGGTRSGIDRRHNISLGHIKEKRSGTDRRNGFDRRSSLEHIKDSDRRAIPDQTKSGAIERRDIFRER